MRYNNQNVTGLVYVSAFGPDEGESTGNFVDVSKLPPGLLVFDSGGFAYINPEMFHQAFVQDANASEAETLAVVQKPVINHLLLNHLALLLGNNFPHGFRCLRATTLSLLMYNVISQNE
jgi:hypothetical protein